MFSDEISPKSQIQFALVYEVAKEDIDGLKLLHRRSSIFSDENICEVNLKLTNSTEIVRSYNITSKKIVKENMDLMETYFNDLKYD